MHPIPPKAPLDDFHQNLRQYASYKALEMVYDKREGFSPHAQEQLVRLLKENRSLVEPTLQYLDTLSEEELQRHFEEVAHNTRFISMLFEQPEELRRTKVEAVGFPTYEIAGWWLEDYETYKSERARGNEPELRRTRQRVAAAHTELVAVHSSMPVYDIGETIARGVFSSTDGNPFPSADIIGTTSGRIELLPFWDRESNQPITPQHIGLIRNTDESEFTRLQEQAINIATSYNEEMATYFYAMDAYWLAHAKDPDDYVDLRVDDLLQYTGKKAVKRRGQYTDTYRPDQIRRAGMMVYGMGFSMVEIERTVIRGVGTRTHYKRLWDVTDTYVMQTLDGQTYIESLRYRPNELFRNASFGSRRETALLMSKVLGLDYDKMVVARRLGRYYTWLWRDRAYNGQLEAPISCGRLIDRMGIEVVPGREANARRALELALDRLEQTGIIAQWLLVDSQDLPVDTGARIAFSRWLNMKISVVPPNAILAYYETNLTSAPAIAQPTQDLDRLALQKMRRQRHITLGQMALQIGIDVSTLSRILSGKTRRPRQEVVEALLRWMAENGGA